MTTTPSPPATRPATFDARVMAYLPGLRRLASRLGYRGEAAEDIVTDTVIDALHGWRSFREDGGFWMWLQWKMRSRSQTQRQQAARERDVRVNADDTVMDLYGTEPTQEHEADLNAAVRRLSGRSGAVLLRIAMGEQLHEVGDDLGVSRQRVLQIANKARADLRKAVR